jgi:hypothetical protein
LVRFRFFLLTAVVIGCLPTFSVAPPCGSSTDIVNCGTCGHTCGKDNADIVSCQAGMCVFQCAGVFAHCSTDDASGCETNLGTSADNCGACGHSCLGGQCVAGKCTPVIIGGDPNMDVGLKTVNAMVAFGGSAYGTSWFSPGGLVWRARSTPGNPLEWIVGPGVSGSASPIATDGSSVLYAMYYDSLPAHRQGLWKIDAEGANDTRLVAGDGTLGMCPQIAMGNQVESIAADGTFIFLTHARDAGSPCPGIVRANADGTDATLFLAGWRFGSLAIDGGELYAFNVTTSTIVVMPTAMLGMPAPLTQATAPVLRTDATHVYWSDGKLHRIAKTGGSSEDVTPKGTQDALDVHVLVDDQSLYLLAPPSTAANPPIQRVERAKKDGSEAASVMATLTTANVGAFAQDEKALYWITLADLAMPPRWFPAIYKLAK